MTNVHFVFLVLLVGNVLWSLSAKQMVMPSELHVRGLSKDMVAAEMSGKKKNNPGPPDLQQIITSRAEPPAFARIIPKFIEFMRVHFTELSPSGILWGKT